MNPSFLNINYLKKVVKFLIASKGRIYRFLNKYNKVVVINLQNLVKLLDSGLVKGLGGLSRNIRIF